MPSFDGGGADVDANRHSSDRRKGLSGLSSQSLCIIRTLCHPSEPSCRADVRNGLPFRALSKLERIFVDKPGPRQMRADASLTFFERAMSALQDLEGHPGRSDSESGRPLCRSHCARWPGVSFRQRPLPDDVRGDDSAPGLFRRVSSPWWNWRFRIMPRSWEQTACVHRCILKIMKAMPSRF